MRLIILKMYPSQAPQAGTVSDVFYATIVHNQHTAAQKKVNFSRQSNILSNVNLLLYLFLYLPPKLCHFDCVFHPAGSYTQGECDIQYHCKKG